MKIIFFAISLAGFIAGAEIRNEVILAPTTLWVTSFSGAQSFNLNFPLTQQQLGSSYQYSISIKNADGQEHTIEEAKVCKDLSHIEKLACLARRSANLTYINNFRVHQADIYFNSVQIANKSTFDRHTSVLVLPVSNVNLQNNILINVSGSFGSYIEVSVAAIVSITDQLPPVVTSSLSTGSRTKNSEFQVSIADQSNTSTEVYKNGNLILTTPEKNFNIELSEGSNNFKIISRDQYGNVAPDLLLENILLDTIAPTVNSNAKSSYLFSSLPAEITIEFYAMEPLSSLTVNEQPVHYDSSVGYYKLNLPVNTEGVIPLVIKSIDLAGNEKVILSEYSASLDNTSPAVELGSVPQVIISDSYLLNVSIVDSSETLTTVTVDGVESSPISEKNFSYLIEFPADGTKNILITTVDAAQNTTIKSFAITKNTGPFIAEVISPLNNTTVNSRLVNIIVSGNKPIQEIVANGITHSINSNALTAKISVQLFNDGEFLLPITVKDAFGASVNTSVKFQITTNSLSSWDYLECHAE